MDAEEETRYRAWAAVHDRRVHRRVCAELDGELGAQEPREVKQVTYPVVYYTAPGELYDETGDRFYRG